MLSYFYRLIERITVIRAFSVIINLNKPINSILSLILAVTGLSFIRILLGCTFVGVIFLVIYIGAIAVLFLFIVMMLDLNYDYIKNEKFKIILRNLNFGKITVVFLIITFIDEAIRYMHKFTNIQEDEMLLKANTIIRAPYYENWLENRIQNKENINLIGTVLYDHYRHLVLRSGLVLLIAMIGSIIVTLKNKR